VIYLCWFDNSEKGEVFGHFRGGCGADPAVALRLRNAAEYRLPNLSHKAPNKGLLDISE